MFLFISLKVIAFVSDIDLRDTLFLTDDNIYHSLISLIHQEHIDTNKIKEGRFVIKQYNTKMFNTIILFKSRTRQIKATETSKLLILIETAASQKCVIR